mgnify:FL=1
MIKEKVLKKTLYDNKDTMYRLALSILKSEADAEDALQDVFVKCWHQKNEIQITSDIKGYLMRATRNRCLDMVKKHNRKYEQSEIYEDAMGVDKNAVEIRDQVAWIDRFLEQLPEVNQTVFHMREVEGIPFEEISKTVNTPISNVRTILSRTKKHLRKQFNIINRIDTPKHSKKTGK